jgi:hypothetical protein
LRGPAEFAVVHGRRDTANAGKGAANEEATAIPVRAVLHANLLLCFRRTGMRVSACSSCDQEWKDPSEINHSLSLTPSTFVPAEENSLR